MDYQRMSRSELQALCKTHNISPRNVKNSKLAHELERQLTIQLGSCTTYNIRVCSWNSVIYSDQNRRLSNCSESNSEETIGLPLHRSLIGIDPYHVVSESRKLGSCPSYNIRGCSWNSVIYSNQNRRLSNCSESNSEETISLPLHRSLIGIDPYHIGSSEGRRGGRPPSPPAAPPLHLPKHQAPIPPSEIRQADATGNLSFCFQLSNLTGLWKKLRGCAFSLGFVDSGSN